MSYPLKELVGLRLTWESTTVGRRVEATVLAAWASPDGNAQAVVLRDDEADGETEGGLLAFRMRPERMPPPEPAHGAALALIPTEAA